MAGVSRAGDVNILALAWQMASPHSGKESQPWEEAASPSVGATGCAGSPLAIPLLLWWHSVSPPQSLSRGLAPSTVSDLWNIPEDLA